MRTGTAIALLLGATALSTGPASAGLPGGSCNLVQSFGMNNWAPVSIQAVYEVTCTHPNTTTGYPIKIYRLTLSGSVLVASGTGFVNYVCNGTGYSESYEEVLASPNPNSESFYCD